MGVRAEFTMTCDTCRRFLMRGAEALGNLSVVATGDLDSLVEEARERGWLLEWQPLSVEEEPYLTHCPECAKKAA